MLRMDKTLDFSKIGDAIDPPGLVEIQTASYDRFLQADVNPQRRKNAGLEALLREIFPIISYDGKASLEYVNYELGEPRYTPEECRQLRLTYGRPFRMRCRLKHDWANWASRAHFTRCRLFDMVFEPSFRCFSFAQSS